MDNIENFNKEFTPGASRPLLKTLNAPSKDFWQVDLDDIHVIEGFNPRDMDDPRVIAHIRSLADSMKINGYYPDKPLAVYVAREGGVDKIYLTEGHMRRAAAMLARSEGADIQRVPIVVKDRSVSIEDLTVALVRSNENHPFSPMEIAIVVKRCRSFGWEPKEIANRLGITQSYVSELTTLLGAPMRVREMVKLGQVSVANAVEAIRKHEDKAVEFLEKGLQTAAKSGKTRLSAKHMPGFARKSYIKKQSTALFDVAREIKESGVIEQLPQEIQQKLADLLAGLEKAESEEQEQQSKDESAKEELGLPAQGEEEGDEV